MKSRITIEVDFNNGNQPVIQILKVPSDDIRDKLIKSFTECLNGSSWCQMRWVAGGNPLLEQDGLFTSSTIFITPIRPEALKEQADIMLEQHRLNAGEQNKPFEWQEILDNSIGFREFLDTEQVKWKPNELFTLIDAKENLFDLGYRFAYYKIDKQKKSA